MRHRLAAYSVGGTLVPGDVIEVDAEGIGLRNGVVDEAL
jgi:hypothetical protein